MAPALKQAVSVKAISLASTATPVHPTGTAERARIIVTNFLGHANTAAMDGAHVHRANLSANAAKTSWAKDASNVPPASMGVRAANIVTPSLPVAAVEIVQQTVIVVCIASKPPL